MSPFGVGPASRAGQVPLGSRHLVLAYHLREARYAYQTVWDSHKQRILLFGGETNPEFEIWDSLGSFSPAKGKWTELKPEGKRPARRAYYAACFDTKRNGTWLHGGLNPNFLDDLWFFDSEKATWKQIDVNSAKPSPRDGHDLYYNPKADQLILLGGLLNFAKFELSDEFWQACQRPDNASGERHGLDFVASTLFVRSKRLTAREKRN